MTTLSNTFSQEITFDKNGLNVLKIGQVFPEEKLDQFFSDINTSTLSGQIEYQKSILGSPDQDKNLFKKFNLSKFQHSSPIIHAIYCGMTVDHKISQISVELKNYNTDTLMQLLDSIFKREIYIESQLNDNTYYSFTWEADGFNVHYFDSLGIVLLYRPSNLDK